MCQAFIGKVLSSEMRVALFVLYFFLFLYIF